MRLWGQLRKRKFTYAKERAPKPFRAGRSLIEEDFAQLDAGQ
jgi:hypothetical protein